MRSTPSIGILSGQRYGVYRNRGLFRGSSDTRTGYRKKSQRHDTSILPVFFMSLPDRENLLDNNYLFFGIDLVKHGIPSGDMKPADESPAS